MAAPQPQNLQEHYRSLKILHFAMCFGVTIMFFLLYFFMGHEPISFDKNLDILSIFAMFMAAISLIFSNILFKKTTGNLSSMSMENIEEWRSGYVLKWAFLEGAALINILIYFFTKAHPVLLVIAMLLILLLYVNKPKTT